MRKMKVGDNYTIHCYKHDGHIYNSYEYSVLLDIKKDYLVFGNNKVKVMEEDGRTWYTKEPAIIFYFKDKWYNVIVQFKKNDIYYYCNIASPFIIEDNTIKYIDYDLDLRVFPSGEYKILDVLEYNYHRKILKYSDDLDTILQKALEDLIKEYVNDSPMFDGKTNYEYYAQFLKIRNKRVHKKQ